MKNKTKRISCMLVAVMIASVGFVAAFSPTESIGTNDAVVLSSSNDETEPSDYITIQVPVSEGSSEYYEVRLHFGPLPTALSTNGSGVTKFEHFSYYPHEELGGATIQHYAGYKVYLSHDVLFGIGTGASVADLASLIATLLVGLAVPIAAAIALVIVSISSATISELYPNGVVFVVANSIYLTQSITLPIQPPRVLDVYSQ